MKKQLNPKVVWVFFVQNLSLSFFMILMFYFVFGSMFLSFSLQAGSEVEVLLFYFLMCGFILMISIPIFSYILAVLSYRNYFYELTDDCFRKEHGIIWKKYVSIPYGRIQNVDIYRGLVARLLGLSDLNIQTAGASVQTYAGEGRLPGLTEEEAQQMRDELIKRTKSEVLGGI
jgi:uncharacterized protein